LEETAEPQTLPRLDAPIAEPFDPPPFSPSSDDEGESVLGAVSLQSDTDSSAIVAAGDGPNPLIGSMRDVARPVLEKRLATEE
jgi:hypothetical protein